VRPASPLSGNNLTAVPDEIVSLARSDSLPATEGHIQFHSADYLIRQASCRPYAEPRAYQRPQGSRAVTATAANRSVR
jgi:hypothetical protein